MDEDCGDDDDDDDDGACLLAAGAGVCARLRADLCKTYLFCFFGSCCGWRGACMHTCSGMSATLLGWFAWIPIQNLGFSNGSLVESRRSEDEEASP